MPGSSTSAGGNVRRLQAVPPSTQRSRQARLRWRTVHGYRRAYRIAGSGPAVLLLHGIGDSSKSWAELMPALARDYTVIAPDLLGHGASDKPRADYSIAAYANGMRDLISLLDIERATVVGHSMGGGVAMQFAYQFPERTERLVLVSSGGVSKEVNPALRALSLPGAELALQSLGVPLVRRQLEIAAWLVERSGLWLSSDARELLRILESFPDPTARAAFARTLRSAVDWRGQVITMLDRCYLAAGMPTLIVWGTRDPVVPLRHGYLAHDAMPGSRLEIFNGAGHFPHHNDPARFLRVLRHFLRTTAPSAANSEQWRLLLARGQAAAPVHHSAVEERSAT